MSFSWFWFLKNVCLGLWCLFLHELIVLPKCTRYITPIGLNLELFIYLLRFIRCLLFDVIYFIHHHSIVEIKIILRLLLIMLLLCMTIILKLLMIRIVFLRLEWFKLILFKFYGFGRIKFELYLLHHLLQLHIFTFDLLSLLLKYLYFVL